MLKHRAFLCKYVKRRHFSACPLPLEPLTSPITSSAPQITRKGLCFSLAEQLISRGLLSSAQKVIQRLIAQCSSIQEAVSAVDFAFEKGIELDLITYGCIIRKLAMSGETLMAKTLYMDCVVGRGFEPDHKLLNSMIICYCKLGQLEEAKCCFDRLIQMNSVPWIGACNTILKGFNMQGRFLESYSCFCEISEATDLMLYSSCYKLLVEGLCHRGYLDEGLHVFDVMIERGVPPTFHLCKSLITGFCKWGRVEEAEILSTEIESYGFVLDKYMYTYLINAYCKGRKMEMAMRLFLRMLKMGSELDNYTYRTLIHGFVNLGLSSKGWILHDKMVGSELKPDLFTYQIMLNKYSKDRKVECAMKLLNDMIKCNMAPNVHCYTTIISALCKEQMWEEVYSLYHKMLDNGVVPDHVLFLTIVKNIPEGDELYFALTVLQTIAYKSCDIDFSRTSYSRKLKSTGDTMVEIEYLLEQIVISNSLLAETAFSIYIIALCMGRKLEAALNCMGKMVSLDYLPFPTAFNSLIKLFFQEGLFEDAESLLELMLDRGLVPNHTTYLIIVTEICKQGYFSSTINILDYIEERGIKPNVAMYSSVINCLGRHKMVCEAENVFYRMLESGVDPDENIFVAMINAYSKNGRAHKALGLFEKMTEYDLKPNSHAYTALIHGLVKKNMTKKSCLYLDRMLKEGFMPNVVLYTSLIKQFLNKRKLEFALRLVDLMEKNGIDQDLISYITLVSGICRNIRDFNGKWFLSSEKTNKATERLFNLLHQATILPKGKSLKVLISSQEDMKYYALQLIQKIKELQFMPDPYLYNGIISGFCWAQMMQEANNHLILMEREGLHPNLVTFTILIGGYMRLGEVDFAIGLFKKLTALGLAPDGILFNALVRGLCKADRLTDAMLISHTMQRRGFIPSKGSYEHLLSSFCDHRSSIHALRIYKDMLAHGYYPSCHNLHCLINLLCKDNKLDEARTVCALMLKRRKSDKNVGQIFMLEHTKQSE